MDSFCGDDFDIVLFAENISDRHYPIDSHIRLINLSISPKKGFFAKIFNIARHIISMRRCIANEAPDIILGFGAYINCHILLSLLFGLNKMPGIILTEHSEEMFLKTKHKNIKYIFFRRLYKILMAFLYRRADYIVTVSKNIALYMKKLLFLPSDKIKVIYNPVNIDKIRRIHTEEVRFLDFYDTLPRIGVISRLSPEKGIYFLIEGFKVLLDKIDARLIIVGDGTERPYLQQMAKELGVEKKTIFTGFTDNPFKYLAKMDVFVLPSLWEGFPNVLLEAMACGVPVIASDSAGGIREVVKNEINGLLIQPRSPAAISDSIYYLLSNDDKRNNIIKEAYRTVKQFDIGHIKKRYESLMFDLAKR